MQAINIKFFILLLFTIGLLTSCGDDDEPPMMQMEEEEEEEEINQVELTFTPNNGESPFTAIWFDADGEGVGEATIDLIQLEEGVSYDLSLQLANTLGAAPEDITEEIREEDDEHMFFFSFTDGIFACLLYTSDAADE